MPCERRGCLPAEPVASGENKVAHDRARVGSRDLLRRMLLLGINSRRGLPGLPLEYCHARLEQLNQERAA